MTLVRFGESARPALEALGLSWNAVQDIFLGRQAPDEEIQLLPGCPPSAAIYQRREHRAALQTDLALAAGCFPVPDPWTGVIVEGRQTLTFPWSDDLRRLFFLPLLYPLRAEGRLFWAVTCGVTGRIMFLYMPTLGTAVYDGSASHAELLANLFARHGALLGELVRDQRPGRSTDIVALVDMVTNYGHQMINHLSGLDHFIAQGGQRRVSRVVVVGRSFFGAMHDLYPELRDLLVTVPRREEMAEVVNSSRSLVVRLGMNMFTVRTRQRILDLAALSHQRPRIRDRYPLVAVTMRTGSRRCENLRDVVEGVDAVLRPRFPKLGYIVDGWVFPETETVHGSSVATALAPANQQAVRAELDAARHIFARLRGDAVVASLIGHSMLDSLVGLSQADVYLAHVGTLQHKLAFLSLLPGVVHGPSHQMAHLDSGAFQAEAGDAPHYLAPDMVSDVGDPDVPAGSRDYVVNDIDAVAGKMLALVSTPGVA